MKQHAQNHFHVFQFLIASLGMSGHAQSHPSKMKLSMCIVNRYVPAFEISFLYFQKF